MFELGKEAVAYQSPQECVDLIRYYLEHEHEREAIAQAGQKRTLQDHTYYQRVQELVDIVSKHL
jgi:spore maturation protein CgeB